MADLNYIVGLNDSEFRAKLGELEGETGRKLGRIGSVIEARTAGARKLVGAVQSIQGAVTAALGLVGLVTAAISAAVVLYQKIAGSAEAAAEAARKEAEARREIYDVQQTLAQRFAESGTGAKGTEEELERKILAHRRATLDVVQKLVDRQTELRERAKETQELLGRGEVGGRGNYDRLFGLEGEAGLTGARGRKQAELQADLAEIQSIGAQIGAALEREEAAASAMREEFQAARQARADQLELELELQVAQAAGDTERVAELSAGKELAAVRAKIEALKAEGAEVAHLVELEGQLVAARERSAEADEAAARAAAIAQRDSIEAQLEVEELRAQGRNDEADRLQRELEMRQRIAAVAALVALTEAEQAALVARILEVNKQVEESLRRQAEIRKADEEAQLRVELLRAQGRTEEADALQDQLEKRRRLRDLEEREDLNDEERARRRQLIEDIYAARAAQRAEGEAEPEETTAPERFGTLAAGFDRRLADLVLGGPGSQVDDPQRQLDQSTRDLKKTMDTLVIVGRTIGARLEGAPGSQAGAVFG